MKGGVRRTLRLALGLLVLLAAPVTLLAQPATPFSTEIQTQWLHEVLPAAESFGPKQGDPPVWPGYRRNPLTGQSERVGVVFSARDLPPMEAGFSGTIDTLVGVDSNHVMTGLKVLDYVETYRWTKGDFLARESLLQQFRNKSIRDEFRIGRDIDGMAGSTVTVFAIARAARDDARRVAEAHLGYDASDPVQDAREARVAASLRQYPQEQLLQPMTVPLPDGRDIRLYFSYLGNPALGAYWVGREAYALADRAASAYLNGDELLLVGIGGSAVDQFRYDQLQVSQDNSQFRRFSAESFVLLGAAEGTALEGQATQLAAIVLPASVDVTRPLTLRYRQLGTTENHEVNFALSGLNLSLAQGADVLSEAEIAQILRAAQRWWNQQPPWGDTPWAKVSMLVLILTLAMLAFLRKSARLRWITLGATVLYLGFVDNSFLSVSHITNTIVLGPGMLLSNLPLLLFAGFTLVTTLLWGRIFCSSLCPFGAVQDFITRFAPRRWQRRVPQALHDKALYLKYLILALIIGVALVASQVTIFHYFEPFGTLFFLQGSLWLWFILIAFLAACFLVPRFYCRYACPLGAALGLMSVLSPLRIKRVAQCEVCIVCERACPTGAIRREKIDFKECVRCDLCEIKLIEKAGACRHGMEHIIASSKNYRSA